MNTIHDKANRLFGPLGLRHLQNERGVMLVLTLVILLVLSSLAATNIINAYLERSLAKNQHYANVTLNAADAGIDHAMTWINENSGSTPDHTNASWDDGENWDSTVHAALPLAENLASGGTYAVNIRFKTEDDFYKDSDGSGNSEIVLYNSCANTNDNCWGFPGATKDGTGEGYPLIEIQSVGSYGGAGSRTVTFVIARNPMQVNVFGAVTANSNISTGGNISIDGRAHDENGNLCPKASYTGGGGGGSCTCTDGYPGITVPTGSTTSIHKPGQTDGEAPDGSDDADTGGLDDYGAVEPNSPEDVLGLDPGTLDDIVGGTPAVGGVVHGDHVSWYDKDFNLKGHMDSFASASDSYGIVVLHNPLFNPEVWDASVDSGEAGSGYAPVADTHAGHINQGGPYDPELDANTADYDAAKYAASMGRKLDLNSNATFKGVIIADRIDKVNGTSDIYGAVVSLSKINFGDTLGNGSATIKFSCDAIETFTSSNYSTKLAWRRQY